MLDLLKNLFLTIITELLFLLANSNMYLQVILPKDIKINNEKCALISIIITAILFALQILYFVYKNNIEKKQDN